MDYFTLVGSLLNQITPETRKQILDRLSEMNDQLITFNQVQSPTPVPVPVPVPAPRPSRKTISVDDILDDIVDDIDSPAETLDDKLSRINNLYKKIIHDKKQRRRNAK